MKRVILLLTGVFFVFASICFAGKYGFETTSEGITESLLGSGEDRSSEKAGWESLADKPKPPEKSREVKVLKKEKGAETWETIRVPEKRKGGFVNLQIQFDVNSFRIRPESYKTLNELGKALRGPKLRGRTITINGHTDSDGKEKYNLKLSLKRASSVKKYLTERSGIGPDRLKVAGYGESMPLKPNTSKKNKQLNRRVEIVAED